MLIIMTNLPRLTKELYLKNNNRIIKRINKIKIISNHSKMLVNNKDSLLH